MLASKTIRATRIFLGRNEGLVEKCAPCKYARQAVFDGSSRLDERPESDSFLRHPTVTCAQEILIFAEYMAEEAHG
jgi:hypothetical protein